jgi:ATP-dependent Clp protease ATP-binding subunit ClpC
MYERFTDRARKVMHLAEYQAVQFLHEYIGTEHVLLGLVAEGHGVAANVLASFNIHLNTVLREVERVTQFGSVEPFGRLPLMP